MFLLFVAEVNIALTFFKTKTVTKHYFLKKIKIESKSWKRNSYQNGPYVMVILKVLNFWSLSNILNNMTLLH